MAEKVSPFLVEPNGMVRTWHDNDDGTFTIKSSQTVETEILDRNKALYNHNDGYTADRTMQRVGSIPQAVIEEYAARGINLFHPAFEAELVALMDNSDYRFLRTAPGRLGKKHRHI